MSEHILNAWCHDDFVGRISIDTHGRWAFEYAAEWIANPSFSVSPHIPLNAGMLQDTSLQRTVEWFFENLLPEGAIRKKIASRCGVAENDTWGLLSEYGKESAGALCILTDGALPATADYGYSEISWSDIDDMILAMKEGKPLIDQNPSAKMSLAGAQEKVAVKLDEGRAFLPENGAPTTHILKPENVNPAYPLTPCNEFFAMQLAGRLGLPVPNSEIITLPSGSRLFAVQRYDRTRDNSLPGGVRRIHQFDLCQAQNVSPRLKYESHGGLDLRNAVDAVRLCALPAVAEMHLQQWLVFNYLIGNDDAHAKNLSFLAKARRPSVAPMYDLLCVEAYHQNNALAMGLAGEFQAGWVEGVHWDAAALECQMDPRSVRKILGGMSSRIVAASSSLLGCGFSEIERTFLQERVIPVIVERVKMIEHALGQTVCLSKSQIEKTGLLGDDQLRRIPDSMGLGKGSGRGG